MAGNELRRCRHELRLPWHMVRLSWHELCLVGHYWRLLKPAKGTRWDANMSHHRKQTLLVENRQTGCATGKLSVLMKNNQLACTTGKQDVVVENRHLGCTTGKQAVVHVVGWKQSIVTEHRLSYWKTGCFRWEERRERVSVGGNEAHQWIFDPHIITRGDLIVFEMKSKALI